MSTTSTSSAQPESSPRWQLVEAHRARLLRMARRRTVCEQDAEDVVAEAMLRAIECMDLEADRLPAWLTTVTVRLCVDVARERVREGRRWARADVATVASSCEQHVCDRAEAAWVAERVAALPNRQARALHLRAAGMDVSGIAESLGVTYRTAESLLARGRATVRATLASTLVAAFLAAWRWLRTTVSQVGGGTVGAAAAVSAASAVAITTVMLGPLAPGTASPVPSTTTPPIIASNSLPPQPTSAATPTTEVPTRREVPASSQPLPADVSAPATPSVSPPAGVPHLPATLPTNGPSLPVPTPQLQPELPTNGMPVTAR